MVYSPDLNEHTGSRGTLKATFGVGGGLNWGHCMAWSLRRKHPCKSNIMKQRKAPWEL